MNSCIAADDDTFVDTLIMRDDGQIWPTWRHYPAHKGVGFATLDPILTVDPVAHNRGRGSRRERKADHSHRIHFVTHSDMQPRQKSWFYGSIREWTADHPKCKHVVIQLSVGAMVSNQIWLMGAAEESQHAWYSKTEKGRKSAL